MNTADRYRVSLATLAKKLGKNRATVCRHAKRHGMGRREGREVLLTAAEVKKLAGILATTQPGNRKSKHRNDLGQFVKS